MTLQPTLSKKLMPQANVSAASGGYGYGYPRTALTTPSRELFMNAAIWHNGAGELCA